MKEIERMLRENLQREAPDHRADILAAEPPEVEKPRPRIFRRVTATVACIAAAAVLAVGVGYVANSGLFFANSEYSGEAPGKAEADFLYDASQPGNTQNNPEGGDGRGEYEVLSWESAVKLPDGETYNAYAFTGNEQLGQSLLAAINSLFGTEFAADINLSEYECRLGDDPAELFLWGNLDAGMFYYQHIIDYTPAQIAAADENVIGPSTEKTAEKIAGLLSKYVGEVCIEKSWREYAEGTNTVTYFYRYVPEKPIVIDGYETVADLTIGFDTLGEVTSLRCDLSACEKYVSETVTFGENILQVFKNTLGDVGIPEARVCITGYSIEYVQTIGLVDHGIANPVLTLTYSVNGEGEYECPILSDNI